VVASKLQGPVELKNHRTLVRLCSTSGIRHGGFSSRVIPTHSAYALFGRTSFLQKPATTSYRQPLCGMREKPTAKMIRL